MGSTCSGQQRKLQKISYIPPQPPMHPQIVKASSTSTRFSQVERLRLKKQNFYKIIMSTNDHQMETISFECRVLDSLADIQIYEGMAFELNPALAPIFDSFDKGDSQFYHQIITQQGHSRTLKIYPFQSYRSLTFKNGIYQIHLYRLLQGSPLLDYFIVSRGKINALVMIFKYYQSTLLDILRYRQLAQFPWTEEEVLVIAGVLVRQLRILHGYKIYHRDIRLSKVFFTPKSVQPYKLEGNLQSARMVSRDDPSELYSVRGINIFTSSYLQQPIEKGEQIALYPLEQHDMQCLAKILIQMTYLDIFTVHHNCANLKINTICQSLLSGATTLQSIQRQIEEYLLEYGGGNKERAIQQDRDISLILSKEEIRRVYFQRIHQSQITAMLNLHKKDQFQERLLDQIIKNQNEGNIKSNIQILHRLGEYYDSVGVSSNDYFKEEIHLLLQTAEHHRKLYLYKDLNDYMERAKTVNDKLSDRMKSPLMKSAFLREMAYRSLYYRSESQKAEQLINQALTVGAVQVKSNQSGLQGLQLIDQLKLIEAKGTIAMENEQYDQAEQFLQKGLQLASERSLFNTSYQYQLYKANFEYLNGELFLRIMSKDKREVKGRNIGKASSLLNSSLDTFKNLPASNQNIVAIINCYISISDLQYLREEYPQCRKALQSADNLTRELQQNEQVSKRLKLKILQRLKTAMNKQDYDKQAYNKVASRIKSLNDKPQESNLQRLKRKQSGDREKLQAEKAQRKKRTIFSRNSGGIRQLPQQDEQI